MTSEPGRGPGGDDDDDRLTAEPPALSDPAFSDPAFSDEGMRRIVYGEDRRHRGAGLPHDGRTRAFTEDTAELETDLRSRRNLIPIVTALAAVVCFAAIVWYAYSWGTGHVASDELPVVSAQPMPEKVRPEQPGGMDVPHQGIAVLNNGRTGETPQVVERLLPRPEVPAPPEPLPAPAGETPAAPPAAAVAPLADVTEAPDFIQVPDFTQSADRTPDGASDGASRPVATAEGGVAKPLPKPLLKPGAPEEDQIAALLEKKALETANGAEPAAAAPPAPAKAQTAVATAGDVVLQLSSVKSAAAANREWARLQAAHPGLLGKLALTLDTAVVEGTTYYRVQTGPFASRAAAADLCTQLKADNQDCLVKQR